MMLRRFSRPSSAMTAPQQYILQYNRDQLAMMRAEFSQAPSPALLAEIQELETRLSSPADLIAKQEARPVEKSHEMSNLQYRKTLAGERITRACQTYRVFADALPSSWSHIFARDGTYAHHLINTRISFADGKVITNASVLDPEQTASPPAVKFTGDEGTKYSLMLIDADYPSETQLIPRILYLKSNIDRTKKLIYDGEGEKVFV